MKLSSGSDISDLEEDKSIPRPIISKNRSHLLEESEFEPSTIKINTEGLQITVGEPQKIREGRDGYYVYPIISKNNVLSNHRYKEFVWLRNVLSLQHPACATPSLPDKEGVIGY